MRQAFIFQGIACCVTHCALQLNEQKIQHPAELRDTFGSLCSLMLISIVISYNSIVRIK